MRFLALALMLASTAAAAAPTGISTFHSISLYWSPDGGA
jgi:hypothetical protein